MELAEVLALLTDAWPTRLEKGRVIHIALNHHRLPNGSTIHLRVMIQRTADPLPTIEGMTHVSLE